MLQQKPCSRNVEIPGGRGGHQRPPWNGNSEGVGGMQTKNLPWEGYGYFLEPHIPAATIHPRATAGHLRALPVLGVGH